MQLVRRRLVGSDPPDVEATGLGAASAEPLLAEGGGSTLRRDIFVACLGLFVARSKSEVLAKALLSTMVLLEVVLALC